MTSDSIRSNSRDTARHFRRLYVLALGLIAGLSIAGQVLVQRSLINQQGGSHVVNAAGYQRMLSQRIAMKMLVHDEEHPDSRTQIQSIVGLRDQWVTAHEALKQQVDTIAFGSSARATITALLNDVRQPMHRMTIAVDVLAERGSLTDSQRAAVLTDQEIFLPLMDAVVMGFEKSVRTRVDFLQRVELTLMLVTLTVLALEALLIFRPAVKRLEASLEQLEERRRQASQRLQSLRHLAGGIAHSFNNILTSILGHAELQKLDAEETRQTTEYIDAQIEGCRRAADIVSQLLKYSGHARYDREPTSLGSWLSEIAPTIAPQDSAVRVVVDVADDATVAIDRRAVAQAVEGIVANAMEATPTPGAAVVVKLMQVSLSEPRLMSGPYRTELPPGFYACIRVIDRGEGITAEELDRIFDPYHTRRQTGRGLGLAAILGVAHGHGGGIEVQSQAGHGSTVSFYLPIIDVSAEREVRKSTSSS